MENLGITKEQAEKLVDIYISNPVTKLHLFEAEAIMRALAKYFNEDEEAWGIIGLLHDIDWDLTKDNQKEHCVKTQEILRKAGANDFLIETVISHGYANEMIPEFLSRQRSSRIQHSLVAAETLTGLIIASALIQPDKKLASVKPESLKKKFKNKAFAANCKRELILECEKASIPLDEFLNIGLKALQEISGKLGL